MINAIQMPEWLSTFWAVYGEMITPILTTLLTAIVTWLAIKIRTDARLSAAKAEAQIDALKNVANREDNKPQLEEQNKQLESLTNAVNLLADIFNIVFQNSDLDPEVKNSLSNLVNKLKYGSEEDLVAMLEEANAKLKEQINELSIKMEESAKVMVEEAVTEEVSRRRS